MLNTVTYQNIPCVILKQNIFIKKIIYKNEIINLYDYENYQYEIESSGVFSDNQTKLFTISSMFKINGLPNLHKDFPNSIRVKKNQYTIDYNNKKIFPIDYTVNINKIVTKKQFIKNCEFTKIEIFDFIFLDLENIDEQNHIFLENY